MIGYSVFFYVCEQLSSVLARGQNLTLYSPSLPPPPPSFSDSELRMMLDVQGNSADLDRAIEEELTESAAAALTSIENSRHQNVNLTWLSAEQHRIMQKHGYKMTEGQSENLDRIYELLKPLAQQK